MEMAKYFLCANVLLERETNSIYIYRGCPKKWKSYCVWFITGHTFPEGDSIQKMEYLRGTCTPDPEA